MFSQRPSNSEGVRLTRDLACARRRRDRTPSPPHDEGFRARGLRSSWHDPVYPSRRGFPLLYQPPVSFKSDHVGKLAEWCGFFSMCIIFISPLTRITQTWHHRTGSTVPGRFVLRRRFSPEHRRNTDLVADAASSTMKGGRVSPPMACERMGMAPAQQTSVMRRSQHHVRYT